MGKPLVRCAAATVFLSLASCGESPVEVVGLAIRTEDTVYELEALANRFTVDVGVNILNVGSRTLYLHRFCGTSDRPASHVFRPAGSDLSVGFLGWGCLQNIPELVDPIPLRPGESYHDEVTLMTYTRDTSELDWTGPFRLLYYVQFSNRASAGPVDLIDEPARSSNTFLIRLPES